MAHSLQPKDLYTVVIGFDDFTQGIEQYEASSPEAALAKFLREAVCLGEMSTEQRQTVTAQHIKLMHVGKMRGVWLWLYAQSQIPKIPSVLGGHVIQTDCRAPHPKGKRT
jgi:hypothetical protein